MVANRHTDIVRKIHIDDLVSSVIFNTATSAVDPYGFHGG